MTTTNTALFPGKNGKMFRQTFDELHEEAENMAMKQHFTGTEDEIDDQEEDYVLSYLYDCYLDCENVPEIGEDEVAYFFQWLDWLQYGYFIDDQTGCNMVILFKIIIDKLKYY